MSSVGYNVYIIKITAFPIMLMVSWLPLFFSFPSPFSNTSQEVVTSSAQSPFTSDNFQTNCIWFPFPHCLRGIPRYQVTVCPTLRSVTNCADFIGPNGLRRTLLHSYGYAARFGWKALYVCVRTFPFFMYSMMNRSLDFEVSCQALLFQCIAFRPL